ncbi:dTMP kinase [Micromonospora sp. NBC_01796]|uniref:dTMP kinase n=1 Tax=Micromonospora sp. NBC_01796 TaxID=2975987 RepID=UPI002DDB1190|nr:dTMP kinase [Micromonospora sp. NBC_01796]WSA82688.1 thymidylate kinase [Micromonospora sp. NBC_01796]
MAPSAQDRHVETVGRGRLRVVALVGIDGSGKTTQAHRLAAALERAGVRTTYSRNAGGRRWFGRAAHRLGRRDARRLLGDSGLLLAESILRWLAIARALVRSAVRRRLAVMDRYSFDQYASIRVHHGTPRAARLARLGYRIFPEPEVTFLLVVDPVEAYRRIELRGTDHESMEYLIAADAAYRSLPEYGTFVVIDANRSPDEVTAQIAVYLRPWLSPEPPPAPPARLPEPPPSPPLPPPAVLSRAARPGA